MTTPACARVVSGHAYSPTPAPIGRAIIPGCECGAHLLGWGVNGATARFIHMDHKKQVLRDAAESAGQS